MNYLKLFLLFALVTWVTSDSLKAQREEVNWVSFEEIQNLNKKEPRKVLLSLVTSWCLPCKYVEEKILSQPEIAQYINQNYYAVKFDVERQDSIQFKGRTFGLHKDIGYRGIHGLAMHMARGKIAYPTLIILNEHLNHPAPIYEIEERELMAILKFFGENHHLKTDWQIFSEYFQN